jgi:acyl-coenzyme A thioesterase PaaI-like protein
MTDIPAPGATPVPSRLGVTARLEHDELVLDVTPRPEVLHHGVVRASVLSFAVDAVAGIPIDTDPDRWTLTTDMTVRIRPTPAPARVTAKNKILRRGRRSVTSRVELTTDTGESAGAGAIGFAHIPRKDGDPPKPAVTPELIIDLFSNSSTLSLPLRDEAAIEVIDAAAGVVQVELTDELRNPAGTFQGAMVALLAEAAAEDLVLARFGQPAIVTDLDLRYLAATGSGPVRTTSTLLGDRADSAIEIELVDVSTGTLTTLVYARATPVDRGA